MLQTIKDKIDKIISLNKEIHMKGQIKLEFADISVQEWDVIIVNLSKKYDMYRHYIYISDELTVCLLLS